MSGGIYLLMVLLAGAAVAAGALAWRQARRARAACAAEAAARHELSAQRRRMRQFVAAVSHDLKSPLAELDMMLQVLARQPDLSTDQRAAHYADLRESAALMRELIDDLVEHHRADAATLRPVRCNLNEQLTRAMERHETALVAAGVQWRIDPAMPAVRADADRLQALLVNLLQNAVRHGRDGADGEPVQVRVTARARGAKVELVVRDYGRGLPPEHRERVFEPFYRIGDGRGTGLGLAIVQRVAEAHGGRAWFSDPDDGRGGAAFHVELPGDLDPQPERAGEQTPAIESPPPAACQPALSG